MLIQILLSILLVACCNGQPSPPRAPSLVDAPIAAASVTYLDGEDWTASSDGMQTIAASIPGDIISDLQRSGLIGDPNYELNWIAESSAWWRSWTYTKSFSLSSIAIDAVEAGSSDLLIVFDGIKMSASISINGAQIGHATNQFLRYEFSLSAAHRLSNNTLLRSNAVNSLTVTFDVINDHTTEGRYMASSGGWDWAAYSWNTTSMGTGESGPVPTRALSFGLWKSVYLATVETSSVAIVHVVPHVFYDGDFPVTPLSDTDNGGFTVKVRIHFWAGAAGASGILDVTGAWPGAHANLAINVPGGDNNVTVTLSAPVGSVRLWWPANTGGAQPLYEISAVFTPSSGGTTIVSEPRRIGFRYVALTTGNDTDATWRAANAGGDGNANQGMMIRVNGAALMIRGANMIPQDEFEGRYDAEAFARMVKSSVESHFNLLRVWGGGVFAPVAFYDACDENGILIYHDMQFAQNGHSPLDQSPSQLAEFKHQVRRLSSHPSIAIWDGCNECHVILNTSTGVYASFVLQTVVGEDVSRPVWPSCPSNGWTAGVGRLDSLPNGSPLGLLPAARPPQTDGYILPAKCSFESDMDVAGDGDGPLPGATPQDCCALCANRQPVCASVVWEPSGNCWMKFDGGQPWPRANRTTCTVTGRVSHSTIEVHGPYQHGSGFPAVNGGGNSDLNPFDSGFPLVLNPSTQSGLTFASVFTSEFGSTGFSSFESMSPTLAPEHWGMHGGVPPDTCTTGTFEGPCNGTNTMAQRNYPQDNYLVSYFGLPRSSFDAVGPDFFKHQTYLSTIAMALNIKMKIESKRSANCFGTMIWQLGEIWSTGGWGSLEYASKVPGGILGGRWKPTHHWYESHLFSDVLVICGAAGNVLIKNDRFTPFSGTLNITKLELATGIETILFTNSTLALPAGPGAAQWITVDSSIDGHLFVLRASVIGANGELVTNSFHPLLPPANWTSLPLDAAVTVVVADEPNDDGSINVMLTSTKLAAFVHLTTLAAGRFSDNAFFVLPGLSGGVTVRFIPWESGISSDVLRSSLRFDHLAAAMQGMVAGGERQ